MEFTITNEMLDAGLRGNDLVVFAYIHAFGECCTTQAELAALLHLSRQSVISILRRLLDNDFVAVRHNAEGKNVYVSKNLTPDVKKLDTRCKETLHETPSNVKKLDTQCKETLHLTGENVKKLDTDTSFNNNNNIYNNNLNITPPPYTAPARTRTREEWHDEPFARRLSEGLTNGGTMCDNLVRTFKTTDADIDVARIEELAEAFAADQSVADSNHVNDGDYRSHFVRWGKIILKEKKEAEERNARRNLTPFERAALGRRQAENKFFEDLQRRLNADTISYEPTNNPKQ